ncbi:DUF3429 domain-containing protein [Caulobacter sp. 17J80-11]|uniref:DUF3429 domain-containing protein n=1 Tax=Caulobacter sp. 17J80-11 TaxID=2763502 RepID=UPI00165372B6|nr:DUF3429 domain-containing protein [Caulobacter sp. 17J80-11]MBC6980143.1 DUF3429 domain-containing protein [Caulobacter sp. 17J80-11]
MTAMQGRAPAIALVLGWLALLPFPIAAGVYAMGAPNLAGPALLTLLTYSTAVLSFLGGVRCGAEITREQPRWSGLALAAAPPLVGWALLALPFLTAPWQLGGFTVAFLLQWASEVHAPLDTPAWYRRLRTPLTLGAAIALAVALEQAISM